MPRFTTRNLLIGTALFAIWGALIVNYEHMKSSSAMLLGPLWLFLLLLPFGATGCILGNVTRGFRIAFLFYTACIVVFALLGFFLDID